MKYSVSGRLNLTDGTEVEEVINSYTLWRLRTEVVTDMYENTFFTFEVWLNAEIDKDSLFEELKPFVDRVGGIVSWHECTHDEQISQPCMILETYSR